MIQKVSLLFFLAMSFTGSVFGQKVKYKDLIVLLEAKQFEKAEPFLKKYLKDNQDNPNAFLYMGMIFQEKTFSNDILKLTDILVSNCDSASLFFDKAYNTITEKEIRRNDEYYQMYSRRDLRTGEFGIKLSDVRLDIETRVKSVKERKEKVKETKRYFVAAEKLFLKSVQSFKEIHDKYESESAFYLRSDDGLMANLHKLTNTFDSAQNAFNSYSASLKQLSKAGYNQQLNLQEILNLKKDGLTAPDFMQDDLKIWDYKRWSKSAVETIEKVINPLRDRLITYDIALNKLHEKIKKDSVSVSTELLLLDDGLFYGQLKKYDADPMPIEFFEMKKTEMRYQSNMISHKPIRDTSNVKLKLAYLTEELGYIRKLDSVASQLAKRDLETDSKNYQHFVTKSFGTKAVLLSLINSTQDYARRERLKKQIEWEATIQATKWVISGADSIPVFAEQSKELRFKPLVIVDEKYTVGLSFRDSVATGYFYSITPTRLPDVKANFEVDAVSFTKRNLPITKCLSYADVGNQIYYALIYSESKVGDKFPVTLVKIYRTGGLAWVNNYKVVFTPTELTFSNENGELTIKTTAGSESRLVVIDKNGKQIQ